EGMEDLAIEDCLLDSSQALVTFTDLPDRPGIAVDMFVLMVGQGGRADISFTVPEDDLADALDRTERVARAIGAMGVSHDGDVAKVSVVGVGMEAAEGVAGRMFAALSGETINVHMITTSEIKISALVDRADGPAAVQAVHRAFGLHDAGGEPIDATAGAGLPKSSPLDVVRRLEGMEDLAIEDCLLDSSQALVTFTDLPDRPGIAADVFEEVGRAGLVVDMIVQSNPRNGRAELSFTVPAETRDRAIEVAGRIAAARGARVADVPHVAKLSITGVGIRSHAGVADRLFKPLADAGINLDLVSTSEVRLNVVVAAEQGAASLRVLRSAFGLA
ncbi:MAG: ACT domain-containing protein, partial [Pirellulales bacterium]